MVIVKNEGTARSFWKIAKITRLIKSEDGKTRAADVRVMGSNEKRSATTLRRPLHLLIPMEITAKEYKSNNDELSARTKLNAEATEFKPCRVRRQLAVAGEIKRRTINS